MKSILFVLIFFPIILFAQDGLAWKHDFIIALSQYRSKLLHNDKTNLKRLKVTIEKWKAYEPNKETLNSIIFRIQHGYLINEFEFDFVAKEIKRKFPSSQLPLNFTENDFVSILQNWELVDLIMMEVLNDQYPFKILPHHEIFDELDFYNIQENDVIAEIGAGNATFSYLLTLLNKDLEIFVNDINTKVLEYVKFKNKHNQLNINFEKFHLIEGHKKEINIPKKANKIIIRNTLHHFSKMNKMLFSIKNTLKEDGQLFILEYPRNEKNLKGCSKRMLEEKIKAVIIKNGFQLIKERVLGDGILMEYQKKNNFTP